ncbi:MAG: hypothetical protein LBB24_02400, partial [Rickettsiales bacterium]|nr:hypothetical protein [Rickettsiales bacterium]
MENGENTLTSEWYTYEGESSSGKPHGVGKVQSKNGSSYDGKFSNGEFNGKGVLTFPDGSSYDGKFCDGEFLSGKIKTTGTDGKPLEKDFTSDFVKGEGIWANPDGLTYIGEFSSRDPNGKGMLIHPDGNVYEGEFSNGELSGKGIFKYSNGDVYEGEFSDGSLSGTGKITCGDTGESFKGEFKNSAPWEGDGTFRDPDGNIFTGKILWGVPWKGNGTFRYPNGNTFEGRFENSRPSGEGTFKLHDGEEKYAIEFKNNGDSWVHLGNSRKFVNALDLSTYEGDLPNGLPRGKGKQEYKNGDFLEGTFENGEFIKGAGKITDSNGKIVYEGELEGPNIRANGHGKRVYKNGDFMKGAFKSGKFIKGTGRITIDDGKEEIVYEGEFSNESLQGKGRKEYKNGEFLDGIFEDGEFVSGTGKITIDDGKEEIVYEGELEGPDDIKTSGHGKIVYKNGDFLEGTFKNGEFIKGTGKTTSYDGKTIYKGGLEGPNKKASGYGRRITDWGSSKVIEEGMFEQGKPRKTISKSSGGGSLHYREYDDSGQPILFRGLDGNLLKSSDGRLLLEKMSEKPLYSTEYERGERKSTLYYSYRDDGTVERVIEINFRRINELLNRGISDPEELVTSGAIRDVTEGVIPLITYNDIRIHIQRCSSQILKNKAKLSGDGFFGGTPEERNIIV